MGRTVVVSAASVLALCGAALGQGRMIAVDSSRVLYEIDLNTGAKTQIGSVSVNAGTTGGLARNTDDGTIYVTSTGNDSVYTLDLVTGTATLIGPYGNSTIVMHGIEFVNGRLYGGSNGNLFDISLVTGAATQIGATGLTSFFNLVYNPVVGVMYATSSATDSFYRVDLTTGDATLIGSLNGPTNPNGLAFNPDDGMIYMVDNSTDNLYTIDTATGAASLIGPTGAGNLLGLVYIPAAQPPVCYANCDGSTVEPILNVSDFICFQNRYAAGDPYANCDGSTVEPVLNVSDFICFQSQYAAGCS